MPTDKTILIVEDDPNDWFIIRHAFKISGLNHVVTLVAGGEGAVNYLSGFPPFQDRSTNPLPDLVLLDLKMPQLNGFDVLRWLQTRQELQHIPVIVFSSSMLSRDIEQARELGAKDFLTKPQDPDKFVEIVRNLHTRWLNS